MSASQQKSGWNLQRVSESDQDREAEVGASSLDLLQERQVNLGQLGELFLRQIKTSTALSDIRSDVTKNFGKPGR